MPDPEIEKWESLRNWGTAILIGLGGAGFWQFTQGKISKRQSTIDAEEKSSADSARNEFLDRIDRQFQMQEEVKELQKKLLDEKEASEKVKELLNQSKKKETINPPQDNFEYENDVNNKILKFRPKVGEWKKPIIAYPLAEKDAVKGTFSSQSGVMFSVLQGENTEHGLVFSVANGGPSASQHNFYSLHYESLPTYVIVGDDGIAMWRINIKP